MNGRIVSDVLALARQIAVRFRRYPWVDVDDAAQEAAVAMLEVVAEDITHLDDTKAYLARVAHCAVWVYTWTSLAPVKLGARDYLYRQSMDTHRESDEAMLDLPADSMTPEESLALVRWRSAVAGRFEELMQKDPEVDKALVRRVLLSGERSEEAAVAEEVPVAAVYYVTQRMRKRIANDDKMIHLLLDQLGR